MYAPRVKVSCTTASNTKEINVMNSAKLEDIGTLLRRRNRDHSKSDTLHTGRTEQALQAPFVRPCASRRVGPFEISSAACRYQA